jgi:hypothetical protein
MLFWATVLSTFGAVAQFTASRRHKDLMPYVAGITLAVTAFFVVVMLFGGANPFERLAFTPPDGNGLNPQLQNPGMVIHPPMLYLGYIAITIPFAFAMAALLSRQLDTGWIHAIRRWSLLAWIFLSVGITLGMWWAYVELGWGGYWAWDPVENASLLPWLTLTAFLHSVMIQEKRGMLKKWNVGLVVGTFLLSIFGTFITRSGIIASVHSFTQSNVGYFFLAFLIVVGVVGAIQYPELNARAVGDAAHQPVQRIDLAHQMPLAEPADCRITGHLADGFDLVCDQRGSRAKPRRGRRRLAAGMAAADNDHVIDRVPHGCGFTLSLSSCPLPSRERAAAAGSWVRGLLRCASGSTLTRRFAPPSPLKGEGKKEAARPSDEIPACAGMTRQGSAASARKSENRPQISRFPPRRQSAPRLLRALGFEDLVILPGRHRIRMIGAEAGLEDGHGALV